MTLKQRTALIDGIHELPYEEGQIIILHYLRGVPLPQAAASLKLPLPKVHKLHADALQKLAYLIVEKACLMS